MNLQVFMTPNKNGAIMNAEERNDGNTHDWVGCIKTNSGIAFNIEYPTTDMVDFGDIATALGMICRYNGQVPSFYSVAEHSVRVAQWLQDNGYPRLALQGLMHDAAEAYIGDIVRPMKLMPQFAEVYNELEVAVERVIGEKFDLELYPMHPIVKEADKAVFEWEVEHIRSGDKMGLGVYTAISRFEAKFTELTALRVVYEQALAQAVDKVIDDENNVAGDYEHQSLTDWFKSVAKHVTPKEEVYQIDDDSVTFSYDTGNLIVNDKRILVPLDVNEVTVTSEGIEFDGVPLTLEQLDRLSETQTLEEIAQIPISPLVPKMHNPGEVRITNAITGGEKGSKIERFDLVPIGPLTALAKHYGLGAEKYADSQWRKGYDWSLSYAALQRHLTAWWNGEDLDPEFGDSHLAAVAWHAFTLLEFTQSCPELDNRYGA